VSLLGWLGVFVLGGVGALGRFGVGRAVTARAGARLPYGTFAVNISGALILGVLTGLTLSDDAALLVGTAAVGSYTTFSTWLFETHRLGQAGRHRAAVANIVVSLVLGVAAVALGRSLGGLL
jgi:CrcB protein